MFIFIFNIFLIIITLLIKATYYLFKFCCKVIAYIFSKNFLRIPFILLLIILIFNIQFTYIASIYFLFLVHTLALKLDIYTLAKKNLNIFTKKLISKSCYKKKLKKINPEFIFLNNLYLNTESSYEEYDFDMYSIPINNILITTCGVFNIKLALNTILDYNNFNFNDKPLKINKEYIFDNSILRETLPLEVPIANIVILPESKEDYCFFYNNSIPYIPINYLNDYIESKFKKPMCYTPQDIKDILLESSILSFDKLLLFINSFLCSNKPIILFSIAVLFTYYIYINLITLLINYF